MKTYEEITSEVVKQLNSTLNKDSTKEQIDVVKGIEKGIKEMGDIHKKLNSDYEGVKTDYINLMKESGNHKETDDGNSSGGTDKLDVDDTKALEKDLDEYLTKSRAKGNDNK